MTRYAKLGSLIFFLIAWVVFGAGCGLQINSPTSLSPAGDTVSQSTATVSITSPSVANEYIGWLKYFAGTCSESGSLVTISVGGVTGTSNCTGGAWSVYLDVSTLSAGSTTVTASHPDSGGINATTSLAVTKFSSNCDRAANRIKNFAAGLSGGANTFANPYIICTPMQLDQIRNATGASHYSLENDIYFQYGDTNGDGTIDGSDTDFTSGSGWSPAASYGYFKGNNFSIHNLTINRPATNNVGLFSNCSITVSDLTLNSPNITGQNYVGSLGGDLRGYIKNVKVISPTISGTNYVGGIVGFAEYGSGARLEVSGGTVAGSSYVGGVSGQSYSYLVTNAISSATIIGTGSNTGGLVGYLTSSSFCLYCINRGAVSGNDNVGGIAGQVVSNYPIIAYSYNQSAITGSAASVGGITGYCNSNGGTSTLSNNFNVGSVTGVSASTLVGSILGQSTACSTSNNYSASDSTCTNTGAGAACNATYTSNASTKIDFHSKTTNPLPNWDFEGSLADGRSDFWEEQTSDYPKLWFETTVDASTAASTLTGSGTSGSPYIIGSAADYDLIQSNPRLSDSYFTVTDTIDISDLAAFHAAFDEYPFSGTFNGGGNTVSNFSVTYTGVGSFGLIGIAVHAHIQNLLIDSPANIVSARPSSAHMLGQGGSVELENVQVTTGGSMNCYRFCGSILGTGSNMQIDKVGSFSIVTGTNHYIGGLIGRLDTSSNVINVFSRGSVSGVDATGGLIGSYSGHYSSLSKCYAAGSVTSTGVNVGGLIGSFFFNTTTHCYSSGNVQGNAAAASVGLAVGSNAALAASNYYFSGASCTNTGGGGCNALLGTSEGSLSNLYDSGLAPALNWDFSTVWKDNSPGAPPSFQ